MMNHLLRKRWRVLVAVCLVYILIYSINSYFGAYELTSTGSVRMSYGFKAPDRLVWMTPLARGSRHVSVSGRVRWMPKNVGGFIFAPLLFIDQKLVHPDRPL